LALTRNTFTSAGQFFGRNNNLLSGVTVTDCNGNRCHKVTTVDVAIQKNGVVHVIDKAIVTSIIAYQQFVESCYLLLSYVLLKAVTRLLT